MGDPECPCLFWSPSHRNALKIIGWNIHHNSVGRILGTSWNQPALKWRYDCAAQQQLTDRARQRRGNAMKGRPPIGVPSRATENEQQIRKPPERPSSKTPGKSCVVFGHGPVARHNPTCHRSRNLRSLASRCVCPFPSSAGSSIAVCFGRRLLRTSGLSFPPTATLFASRGRLACAALLRNIWEGTCSV